MPTLTPLPVLEEAARLRAEGNTLAQIGAIQRVTAQEVHRRLKRLRTALPEKVCALPECAVKFWPRRATQLCCSRPHLKRLQMRRRRGVQVQFQQCGLPGCELSVLRRGYFDRFCSRAHADMHRRWIASGLYARLLGLGPRCIACGEPVVLDEHHVEYPGGRSNKEGPVVCLCPTHHMAVHRGVARVDDGVYVSLVDVLRTQLESKHPTLVQELQASGYTWADKG